MRTSILFAIHDRVFSRFQLPFNIGENTLTRAYAITGMGKCHVQHLHRCTVYKV